MANVLIDTSVWIEFFRKREPYYEVVSELIGAAKVSCNGIILAELMQGVKTSKELSILNDFPHTFHFLPENLSLWIEAGHLSYQCRRKGATIGLADCYIAVSSLAAKESIATLDNHFEKLRQFTKIRLHKFY